MTAFRITGGLIGFIWNPIWFFLILILLLGKIIGSVNIGRVYAQVKSLYLTVPKRSSRV
jgi:hypothetical protein